MDRPVTDALQRAQPDDTEGRGPEPPAVRGRTRAAIDLMVWRGVPRDMAAAQCGMKAKSLCDAFRLPSVKAYYMAQLEVLRSSERARNIHRLVAIRDAANNMPAVQAIKALEQLDDIAAAQSAGLQRLPGLQIVITSATQALPSDPRVIEHDAQEPVPQR
jgi:hypothetical protein